jgi:hypothetical protein
MSRTKFGLTTPPAEIVAVRSKNEFLEVPINTVLSKKIGISLAL